MAVRAAVPASENERTFSVDDPLTHLATTTIV
jgi:hypothetical protein